MLLVRIIAFNHFSCKWKTFKKQGLKCWVLRAIRKGYLKTNLKDIIRAIGYERKNTQNSNNKIQKK